MSSDVLLRKALQLSAEERTALAMAILDSVDGPPDHFEALSESEFEAEILRRAEHAHQHPEDSVSWEELSEQLKRTVVVSQIVS